MAGTKRSCCNRFCCFSSCASDEEGQDHPASAGPRSSPSAIVNTTETLPGPPERSEAPIPGSSNVETPRKDEIEQHVDPNLDVSRTHQCDKAPLSESQNILRKFEGEGQDHPPSVGPRSSHSAIEGTHSVPPKNSEAPKCEVEHLEANLNVSGPPHQCDKAQASASPNILQKSEDENVNVNKNVSRDPGYNETPPTASSEASKHDMRTKASISVSSNAVPKKYEVQHVDANLKAHQGDKAPSPSQSFNVPQKSEGANVNINQNVSAGPGCSGTPSSSSPSEVTKSDLLKTIVDQAEEKRLDVNIDDLMDHIYKLLKLREEEMLRHKKASNPSNFRWPEGFKKLKGILSCGTDLKNLTQLLSSGSDFASKLKEIISGPIKTLLREIGQASVATAGLLVIAYSLERFDELSTNKEKCWDILKEMSYLATVVTRLKQSRKGTQEDVIEETTLMIAEGAIMCCSQIASSPWNKFFLSSKNKADLSEIRQKLNNKYMQINLEIGFRVLTAIESKGMSPLSKKYPKDAVGMEKSIEEVLDLLECESDQKVVTVILHGFGGMGKTTLADAVFSHVGGCRYSHVQLFENIDSKPNIIELQKKILRDVMGPEEPVPDIRKYQDGQRELGERLEKIEAFIYIDNVLEGAALKQLLPQDMSTAKKVRLLLTARNANVKNACPWSRTKPKIYKMQEIHHPEALIILKREIKDGINDSQFNDIIDTCGGIPLMLRLVAASIGRAGNKEEAYATLMRHKVLSHAYPTHAYPTHAVGIAEPIEEVLRHLEIQSDDQNAVTVILHGFGGMGKTTLADAVFSEIGGGGMGKTDHADAVFWKIGGGKRSKVRLFEGIKSTPVIIELQKQILDDLMDPRETRPKIRTHEDGQRALEGVLRNIHAFIYIDNVLEPAALQKLLPQDMTTAKKVRLLLTARDETVKYACPRSRTEPKIYNMQEIHHREAMIILKREIEEGVTETQFSEIIQICGGIPLMLTLAAAFIRGADNKEEAYAKLMEQKDKWTNVQFKEMRYAFAYDAIPRECKDPFLDICTYFNGWNWDIVKDIVGDDALGRLMSRALVGKTTNGFARVHDVILTLARQMSKEDSKDKEVRCKFTNASKLKKFLEEGDTEGITGIWLTERKEDGDDRKEVVVQASALDKMQKSLRVLQLGNSIKVEGNCNEIFKELCFFKANISRLPFTVSQLTQLRYLSYDPPNWGSKKMEENRHEWEVTIKGTKQVFTCLVGGCAGNLSRSKLSGLNHHRATTHNLPPNPPRQRGRVRDANATWAVKSTNVVKRQNAKIQYDLDARLCRARQQAYKRFVNEEIFSASVVTFDQLNDTSKQRICEKIQRWDQSLPRRRMETMKRIDIALKEKVRTEVPDGVGEEGLDGQNHILNFDENNQDNDNTPNQQNSPNSSHQLLRRSPRFQGFQGVIGPVFPLEPSQSMKTPCRSLKKNGNEMVQMLQPSSHPMSQCKSNEYTSPKTPLHMYDGGHDTQQKSHSPQPL